jgi:hypothetical protein
MNKGILCGACNEKFGALDGKLSSQLELINGMIGVRPDHALAPRKAKVSDPLSGSRLKSTGAARPRKLRRRCCKTKQRTARGE